MLAELAIWVRSRRISSCWAAIWDTARVRNAVSSVSSAWWVVSRQAQLVGFGFEPGDLFLADVGRCAGGGLSPTSVFELGLEVAVGGVEAAAGDACFGGEGAQVASAAGGDDSLQQPVHRCPDALLGLAAGLIGDSHSVAFEKDPLAASISSTTRWARSS